MGPLAEIENSQQDEKFRRSSMHSWAVSWELGKLVIIIPRPSIFDGSQSTDPSGVTGSVISIENLCICNYIYHGKSLGGMKMEITN
jgi:ribosomal protein L21E